MKHSLLQSGINFCVLQEEHIMNGTKGKRKREKSEKEELQKIRYELGIYCKTENFRKKNKQTDSVQKPISICSHLKHKILLLLIS